MVIYKNIKCGDADKSYRIKFVWDDEAEVWGAISQDVPGLVLESESFDALLERLHDAIPELLELNEKVQSV